MKKIIPTSRRRSAHNSPARQARSRQPAPLRAIFPELLHFRPAVESLETRSLMATMTSLDFSDLVTMANTGIVPAEFAAAGLGTNTPLHNSIDPEDVNDDGACSPSDALAIINLINRGGSNGAAPDGAAAAGATGTLFCDVNDDGQTSPADALRVINRLNDASGGRHQPPPTTLLPPASSPTEVRSIDGTGNNVAHPAWGSAGVDLLRTAPAAYSDGFSAPAGENRPSARLISNTVADSDGQSILNTRQLSAMAYAWGQFVDHDIDLTPTGGSDMLPIAVPQGDPSFDPTGAGTQVISTARSIFDPATGATNPRQQVNTITAFLDGSMIYGSSDATALALRTGSGGQLKTSAGNLLPLNNDATFPDGALPMANDAGIVPLSQLFAAGDVRANENIELTALQTLFMREHNQWATKIAAANPNLTDEQIYQQARAIVIGEIQAITYNQWLPTLLGSGAISAYRGYNPGVNPGIANEFSTAAFRFGHSLLGDDIEFLDNNGNETQPEIALAQAFFNPPIIAGSGIDPLLKYLASDQAQELDTKVVDSVRNFLFGPPGAGGLDLASLNIERGRDNGIADYNSLRAAYGLPKVSSFAQITPDAELQSKLQSLYGSVDDIDAWVGLLAEKHVAGANVGPTLKAIIADQFTRIRDGDRFWYQRVFTGPQLAQIDNTTLADIIERNSGVTGLQKNVFVFRAQATGAVYLDANSDGTQSGRAEPGLPGVTVQLIDEEGSVVASTVTSLGGAYRFDQFASTGDYGVQIVLPTGAALTKEAVLNLHIATGDASVRNLNFGLKSSSATPPPAMDVGFEHGHGAHEAMKPDHSLAIPVLSPTMNSPPLDPPTKSPPGNPPRGTPPPTNPPPANSPPTNSSPTNSRPPVVSSANTLPGGSAGTKTRGASDATSRDGTRPMGGRGVGSNNSDLLPDLVRSLIAGEDDDWAGAVDRVPGDGESGWV
jgi:hypothetical protein